MPVTTIWKTLTYGGSGLRWTDVGNFPSTSPGSIGNGALTLQYKRTAGVCFVRLYLFIGSSTSLPGTNGGSWTFELPTDMVPDTGVLTPTASGGSPTAFHAVGTCLARNNDGITDYVGAIGVNTNPNDSMVPALFGQFNTGVPTSTNLNNGAPWSWTTGDQLFASASFPALDN